MNVKPVILESNSIQLQPMELRHCDALCDIAFDEELWRNGLYSLMTKEAVVRYVEDALDQQGKGSSIPFVTILKSKNTIIGSTRFLNIDPKIGKSKSVRLGSAANGSAAA